MNKKYDYTISTALRDTKAYDFYFSRFNNFSLIFIFLTPKERDLHCSHEIMLRTKLTHTYTYYKFIQHHYITNTPSRNPQQRFILINSKYTSPYFLNFTYSIKVNNMQGTLQNYDPIRQTYNFCSLTKCFDVEESRPLIVPHEYIPPIEAQNLEYFHNTKYNHKLYNLI